jgi:TRAP-type mannitol/chloroaromatic compound transport system substrate-binding protein
MRAPLFAVALALCALGNSVAIAARHEAKGAKITLHATWPSTPLLHEAAEFLVRWSAAACGGQLCIAAAHA